MKKIVSFAAFWLFTLVGLAQQRICVLHHDTVTYHNISTTDSITFGDNANEPIDLGLSVIWASCNVGASSPEEYGDYFAWAETTPKSKYHWKFYQYCTGYVSEAEFKLTKYCDNPSFGIEDGLSILVPSDDAATINWGAEWRTPNESEMLELVNQCTWTWTLFNGVYGYEVVGPNGNSIFLPAAGVCQDKNNGAGSMGYYWTNTLYGHNQLYAYALLFSNSNVGVGTNYYQDRSVGLSVRPVCSRDASAQQPNAFQTANTTGKSMNIWGRYEKAIYTISNIERISFED